jgi:hypothetical protein
MGFHEKGQQLPQVESMQTNVRSQFGGRLAEPPTERFPGPRRERRGSDYCKAKSLPRVASQFGHPCAPDREESRRTPYTNVLAGPICQGTGDIRIIGACNAMTLARMNVIT